MDRLPSGQCSFNYAYVRSSFFIPTSLRGDNKKWVRRDTGGVNKLARVFMPILKLEYYIPLNHNNFK